jgi:hypothetical protein
MKIEASQKSLTDAAPNSIYSSMGTAKEQAVA